ncbi:MAG: hypothetical protein IPO37_23235 [Saprospiraceae bacterium]|nr:hypothetical protein [Saprospiraceae bacterium]
MMRNYLSTFLMVNFLLTGVLLQAQNALVPDILPSADATALGKYDKFQVSSYTGQVDISIPLYTLQANNKTIDLRLNYDGSGILARQHPGWVGQNWSLKAGGVITRTVHGLADEYGMTNGPEYNNTSFSYISVIKMEVLLHQIERPLWIA